MTANLTQEDLKALYADEAAAGNTNLTEKEWIAMYIVDQARARADVQAKKMGGPVKPSGKTASVKQAVDKKQLAKKKKNDHVQKHGKQGDKPEIPAATDQAKKPVASKKQPKKTDKASSVPDTEDKPLLDDKGQSTLPPMIRISTEEDPPIPEAPEKVDDIQVLTSGLTAKQELFCREYVADKSRNGTQCATRAGYAPDSAHVAASRLLKNDKVRAFIAALVAPHFAKLDITAEELLQEYANMARVNNYDFVQKDEAGLVKTDENGLPIPDFSNLTRAQMSGLLGMEIVILPALGEDEPNPIKVKWKLGNKKEAMDVLAKRAGLLKEHIVHEGHVKVVQDDRDLAMRVAFILRQAAQGDKKEPGKS